jgi:hypothetical protein
MQRESSKNSSAGSDTSSGKDYLDVESFAALAERV